MSDWDWWHTRPCDPTDDEIRGEARRLGLHRFPIAKLDITCIRDRQMQIATIYWDEPGEPVKRGPMPGPVLNSSVQQGD